MNSFLDYIPIFKQDIPLLIEQSLDTNEAKESIISMNQEQLQKGIDSKGTRIETIASQEQHSGYPYSRYTVKLRGEQGLQVQNVDLKDTGAFYDSMNVEVTKEQTKVLADFDKPDGNIMDNFNKSYDFLGLTKDNLKGFVQWCLFELFSINLRKSMNLQ
jgi:hypothetical protein